MNRIITRTGDGSHTIIIPEMNVGYHSKHGAIQESMHVYIEAGLQYLINQSPRQPISIFEMGFGTGLNAFLTAIEAMNKRLKVYYTAAENNPLGNEEIDALNYTESLNNAGLFKMIHHCKWNENIKLNDFFTLRKNREDIRNYSTNEQFNLIYYDAFAPSAQPELWTEEVFQKLYSMLLPGGIVVTYCSKGDVRRAMKAAGFTVEKIPGPPGKREMVRAHLNPPEESTSQCSKPDG